MNPGERLYERLTDEIGVSFLEVLALIEARWASAHTAIARYRLRRLEDQYIDRVVRDVDPRCL